MRTIRNKFTACLIALTTILAAGSASAASLTDTNSHWAKDTIAAAVEKGYVDGYEDASFKPDKEVSRAEFMAMIARGIKASISTESTGGAWYDPYKSALARAKAYRDGDFADADFNKPATRLEMVKIALRAADPKAEPDGFELTNSAFMYNAVKDGLVQGVAGGQLEPEGLTTRAQAVTIVERVLDLKNGKKLEVDKKALAFAQVEATGNNLSTLTDWEPRNMGQKISLGDDAYTTIEQVVVSDPANPDDPFLSLFNMENFPKTTTPEKSYMVAIKFNVHVGERADKDVVLYKSQHFSINGKDGVINTTKEWFPGLIKFSEPGEYSGWVAGTIPKFVGEKPKMGIDAQINGTRMTVAISPKSALYSEEK